MDTKERAIAMQEYDVEHGAIKMTLREIEQELKDLGYKIDRRFDCLSIGHSSAGHTFPALSVRIFEADTGKGFSHQNSRRDENFEKLQLLRSKASCLHNGKIVIL